MLSNRFASLSVFGVNLALFTLVLLPFAVFVVVESEEIAAPSTVEKLKVRVFYETLCPDSMNFMCYQLNNAMINNNWLPYTDLEFLPYGKVKKWFSSVTNTTLLYCQHGHTECELNALHACIVEHYPIEVQMKLFNCHMYGFHLDIEDCAERLQVDLSAAKLCKEGRSTADILEKYGRETDALDISFVPTIEFDGVFNREEQQQILYNFGRVFCQKYETKFNKKLNNC